MVSRLVLALVLPVLLIAVVASPAVAARNHRHAFPALKTVERGVNVPAGKVRSLTVKCPRGLRYLSSRYDVGGLGIIQLLRATNRGATFRVANTLGSSVAKAKLAARCMKPRTRSAGSHAHAIVTKFVSKRVALPGRGATKTATVSCGAPIGRWTVINTFLNGPRAVWIVNSTRDSTWGDWEPLIRNDAPAAKTTVTMKIQCLRDLTTYASGGGFTRHRHKLGTELEALDMDAAGTRAGEVARTVRRASSCFGRFPVSVLWQFNESQPLYLTGFRPRSERFGLTVLNRGPRSDSITVDTICLDKETSGRFH